MSSIVINKRWKCYIGIGVVFFAGMVAEVFRMPAPSEAAEPAQIIEVLHLAPDGKSIPTTANWMTLSVELKNTRSIDLKVRLVGSRDGRFMDVTLPRGALNSDDRPTYQMEIPAPAAAMSYQFIVHQPDGTLATSRRFSIQRPCVQNYRVDVTGSDTDAAFRKQVGDLVSRAKVLERDRANYDAALKIIEELRNNIPG